MVYLLGLFNPFPFDHNISACCPLFCLGSWWLSARLETKVAQGRKRDNFKQSDGARADEATDQTYKHGTERLTFYKTLLINWAGLDSLSRTSLHKNL